MLRRFIRVKGQYEGWHEYKDAPVEVEFLRSEHRHMFQWEAQIEVLHDDRELEFFLVKRHLENQINYWLNTKKRRNLGSCEMQADTILHYMQQEYGTERYMQVVVSEDGESDATVIYNP